MNEPSRQDSWKIFDRIAPAYDRINRILSFGKDRTWRRKLSHYLPAKKGLHLLDVATGTGDQLFSLLDASPSIEKAVGVDLSLDMLNVAVQKLQTKPYKDQVQFQRKDAENLSFAHQSFDVVSFSFGIRNVVSPKKALQEIQRILKPKGHCLILEFSLPPHPIRGVYLFYLRQILPRIGSFFSQDNYAYRYLNQTIETFPYGKEFAFLMKEAGFFHIKIIPMALGAVSLYVGVKL